MRSKCRVCIRCSDRNYIGKYKVSFCPKVRKREFHNMVFANIKRLFAKNLRILPDFFGKSIEFVTVMC